MIVYPVGESSPGEAFDGDATFAVEGAAAEGVVPPDFLTVYVRA
jgi:hypothetical protein